MNLRFIYLTQPICKMSIYLLMLFLYTANPKLIRHKLINYKGLLVQIAHI